ncbi:hypothetical protein N7466_008071 [Penicillium verhagenii]|uniref:uncharacterized protein n=1 Tax=Penicillium verhagenii TaxID=1562060 RepID=UPI0025450805|nr:uncharacterized protein N7466_008071 [Penicillium verhagenii]KAJ5923884.1 hypothetical protein N7466_008071 [Penicillium verhagenii]
MNISTSPGQKTAPLPPKEEDVFKGWTLEQVYEQLLELDLNPDSPNANLSTPKAEPTYKHYTATCDEHLVKIKDVIIQRLGVVTQAQGFADYLKENVPPQVKEMLEPKNIKERGANSYHKLVYELTHVSKTIHKVQSATRFLPGMKESLDARRHPAKYCPVAYKELLDAADILKTKSDLLKNDLTQLMMDLIDGRNALRAVVPSDDIKAAAGSEEDETSATVENTLSPTNQEEILPGSSVP